MPSTRPTTWRSARTSTRPGDCCTARVKHFHIKDYDARTHRNVPAGEGDGQIPSLLERAVQAGYDGFAVLEPHLVVAELSFGFTGPERFGDAATALKNILDERDDRLRLKSFEPTRSNDLHHLPGDQIDERIFVRAAGRS